jgi:hypothetical protein
MAHVKVLQEWTTIKVPVSENVAQDEAGWLDLTDYDDIVIWSQVRTSTNITSMAIETSPTKDDGWFTSMATPSVSAASTPVVTKNIFASATTPLARFVRWKITASAGGTGEITFRIWIVANPIGK